MDSMDQRRRWVECFGIPEGHSLCEGDGELGNEQILELALHEF